MQMLRDVRFSPALWFGISHPESPFIRRDTVSRIGQNLARCVRPEKVISGSVNLLRSGSASVLSLGQAFEASYRVSSSISTPPPRSRSMCSSLMKRRSGLRVVGVMPYNSRREGKGTIPGEQPQYSIEMRKVLRRVFEAWVSWRVLQNELKSQSSIRKVEQTISGEWRFWKPGRRRSSKHLRESFEIRETSVRFWKSLSCESVDRKVARSSEAM